MLQSKITNVLGILFVTALIFFIMVLPLSFRPTPSLLNIGDVAFQDIRAPRSFSFISEYLTQIAQDEAEKTVTPVFLPADPTIGRKQIETLKIILNFIYLTRVDAFTEKEQKFEDIQALEVITISENTANVLVNLTDERWDSIQAECLFVLEQVMRNSIREDLVSSIKRNLSTQIGLNFNEQEISIINEIVSQLIIANSLYSNEKSSDAILAARQSVEPVNKGYAAGLFKS